MPYMKHIKLIVVVLILLAAVVVTRVMRQQTAIPKEKQTETQQIPAITLVIDDGELISTFSGIPAVTAFEALTKTAREQNITLTTKQYDFGIFVEAIDGKAMTDDRSWIYFVNNVSATVAADMQPLQSGDTVSWRYMKPDDE